MTDQSILVVDDDQETLEMMGRLLSMEGYQPILCSDAAAAYEIARRTQPDLVILDVMMGDPEAGWTILTRLRADPATAQIPAIMYSADAQFLRTRKGILRMNACAILEKPFHMHDLLLGIAEMLGPQPVV